MFQYHFRGGIIRVGVLIFVGIFIAVLCCGHIKYLKKDQPYNDPWGYHSKRLGKASVSSYMDEEEFP